MEFEDVIRERFSTRKFSDKKVEQEKIDKILEAGRLAPTAKNGQPIKMYVVTSEEGLSKIDKVSPCRYGAQCVMIVCGDENKSYDKNGHKLYEMDASIVATHMMLEATNVGVDNIWVELFDVDMIKEEFNMPEEIIPVCILPMGYRIEDHGPCHLHNERKNIEELVEYV